MRVDNQPDVEKAKAQWNNLLGAYLKLGVDPWLVGAEPGLPDMCFTANAGWCRWGRVVLASFKHLERTREEQFFREWWRKHERRLGITVHEVAQGKHFEGQGDVVTVGHYPDVRVLIGYGTRTDEDIVADLEQIFPELQGKFCPIRLKSADEPDPRLQDFYHLDTCCFYILSTNTILYYPEAFDGRGRAILENLPCDLLPVTQDEAERFVCNAVFVDRNIVVNSPGERLTNELRSRGLRVIKVDTSEFQKSGGSVRCLTQFLPQEKLVPLSS